MDQRTPKGVLSAQEARKKVGRPTNKIIQSKKELSNLIKLWWFKGHEEKFDTNTSNG